MNGEVVAVIDEDGVVVATEVTEGTGGLTLPRFPGSDIMEPDARFAEGYQAGRLETLGAKVGAFVGGSPIRAAGVGALVYIGGRALKLWGK